MTRHRKLTGARPEARKHFIGWRVTEEEHAKIKGYASMMGLTFSELMDLAINAYVERDGKK